VGDIPDLRVRVNLRSMAVLAEKEWIPADGGRNPLRHITGRASHRFRAPVQMIRDAHTNTLGYTSDEGFDQSGRDVDLDLPRCAAI